MGSTSRHHVWSRTGRYNANKFRNLISDSWKRCEESYGLASHKTPSVDVLDAESIRLVQARCEDLALASAKECRQLHAQTSRAASIVVLTNAEGVIIKTIGSPSTEAEFRNSFLIPGAVWSEQCQGTNGMGTSLASDRLVTVHKSDHFFKQYNNLTCISAPIHDHRGKTIGALDVTTMQSKFDLDEQEYTCNLVQASTNSIEHEYFQNKFSHATVIGFHPRPESLGHSGEGLIALDENGEILAVNGRSMTLLKIADREKVLGRNILELFEAPEQLVSYQGHDHFVDNDSAIFDRTNGRRFAAKIKSRGFASRSQHTRSLLPGLSITGNHKASAPTDFFSFSELAGHDPSVKTVCDRLQKVADKNINIVICGETGTGKEEMARAIYRHSALANEPLVVLNCAGLSEKQLYADLLSNYQQKTASDGFVCTILLDQISDLSTGVQEHILHILQSSQVPAPVEGKPNIPLRCRLISTDRLTASELSDSQRLRPELYYRLNELSVELPAVRDRVDVEHLISSVLKLESATDAPPEINRDALKAMLNYPWPGNIRELRSVIRTALAMCEDEELGIQHLPDLRTHQYIDTRQESAGIGWQENEEALQSVEGLSPVQLVERDAILRALENTHWNLTRAAISLEMSRSTIYRKIRKYRISID